MPLSRSAKAQAQADLPNKPPGYSSTDCPLDKSPDPTKHWVEIELLDEQDQPVAGESYKLILPDGTTKEGATDPKGIARLEDIEGDGKCKLSFPNLGDGTWEGI